LDEAADAGRAGSALSRAGPPGHRHQAPEPVHRRMMAEVVERGQVRASGPGKEVGGPESPDHRPAREFTGSRSPGDAP